MQPRIEVFRGGDRRWYFRVLASNSRIVCQSEGYVSRGNCLRGVEAMRCAVAEACVEVR